MPPASEPSTRLSRVVPHEACLAMSASVTPYLSKIFFSLAMISGEASVSAMKPSFTLLVSGPAACAKAPDGKEARAAATSAAVAVALLRTLRRPNPADVILLMLTLLNVEGREFPGTACRAPTSPARHGRRAAGDRSRDRPRPSRARRRDR